MKKSKFTAELITYIDLNNVVFQCCNAVCASNFVLCSLQQIISTKIAAIKEEINKQK